MIVESIVDSIYYLSVKKLKQWKSLIEESFEEIMRSDSFSNNNIVWVLFLTKFYWKLLEKLYNKCGLSYVKLSYVRSMIIIRSKQESRVAFFNKMIIFENVITVLDFDL